MVYNNVGLQIFESHGVGVAGHVTTGKPPNMAILLHATKQQLQSSAFQVAPISLPRLFICLLCYCLILQNALLNETYELMLHYFAIFSPTIGFPELAYPSIVRVPMSNKLP